MPPPGYVSPRLDANVVEAFVTSDLSNTNVSLMFADLIAQAYPEHAFGERLRAVIHAWSVSFSVLRDIEYSTAQTDPVRRMALSDRLHSFPDDNYMRLPVRPDPRIPLSRTGIDASRPKQRSHYGHYRYLTRSDGRYHWLSQLVRAFLIWLHYFSDAPHVTRWEAMGPYRGRAVSRHMRAVQLKSIGLPDAPTTIGRIWPSCGWPTLLELITIRLMYGAYATQVDCSEDWQQLRLDYVKAKKDWAAWSPTRLLDRLTGCMLCTPIPGVM